MYLSRNNNNNNNTSMIRESRVWKKSFTREHLYFANVLWEYYKHVFQFLRKYKFALYIADSDSNYDLPIYLYTSYYVIYS